MAKTSRGCKNPLMFQNFLSPNMANTHHTCLLPLSYQRQKHPRTFDVCCICLHIAQAPNNNRILQARPNQLDTAQHNSWPCTVNNAPLEDCPSSNANQLRMDRNRLVGALFFSLLCLEVCDECNMSVE